MTINRLTLAAILLTALGLGACHAQHSIEGSQSQFMNVEGKRVKVDLKPTDVPGQFDILVVRDAIVVSPDPETERERGRDAATRVMEEVCGVKRLRHQVVDERLVQQLNYHVRFRCV